MIERFDNIGVAVTDFKRSADWYGKLGFQQQDDGEAGGAFTAGDAVLYIFQTDSTQPARRREHDHIGADDPFPPPKDMSIRCQWFRVRKESK